MSSVVSKILPICQYWREIIIQPDFQCGFYCGSSNGLCMDLAGPELGQEWQIDGTTGRIQYAKSSSMSFYYYIIITEVMLCLNKTSFSAFRNLPFSVLIQQILFFTMIRYEWLSQPFLINSRAPYSCLTLRKDGGLITNVILINRIIINGFA